ncbi:MAG: hypothetical protein R3E84_02120 [Pseudomonadales bacterium]|nr:hypothetical protein [Pseudomonadales bacterium]
MATTPDESGDAFEIAIAPSRDGPVIEAESVPDEALSREVSGAMRDVTTQATPASPAVPVESGTVMAANAAHDEARETEEAADQHAQAVEAEAAAAQAAQERREQEQHEREQREQEMREREERLEREREEREAREREEEEREAREREAADGETDSWD